MERKGRLVCPRASANECISEAAMSMARLHTAMYDLPNTPGGANRLNDYVRDVLKYLKNAEKLLEGHGQ